MTRFRSIFRSKLPPVHSLKRRQPGACGVVAGAIQLENHLLLTSDAAFTISHRLLGSCVSPDGGLRATAIAEILLPLSNHRNCDSFQRAHGQRRKGSNDRCGSFSTDSAEGCGLVVLRKSLPAPLVQRPILRAALSFRDHRLPVARNNVRSYALITRSRVIIGENHMSKSGNTDRRQETSVKTRTGRQRRALLKRLGRFAAVTAPTVTLLLAAQTKPGNAAVSCAPIKSSRAFKISGGAVDAAAVLAAVVALPIRVR
jgi:hypothetical protein